MTEWFEEVLYPAFRTRLRVDKVLYRGESEHQQLLLFENEMFGRVLALNGIVQTTERDEFIYHEMLTHVPLFAHGRARNVLIIGGGDGGMLEEVLKHRDVEKVTMVEIDGDVVTFSKQHLGFICNEAFDDPRLDLVIADGIDFVEKTDKRYDVIIVDSTDPVGPGEVLFTQRFYSATRRCLTEGGVLVTQNGVPFLQSHEIAGTASCLRPHFRDVSCYLGAVPIYVGGVMAFGWASDDPGLRGVAVERLWERYRKAGFETRHYTPDVHHGAFALPPWVAALLQQEKAPEKK